MSTTTEEIITKLIRTPSLESLPSYSSPTLHLVLIYQRAPTWVSADSLERERAKFFSSSPCTYTHTRKEGSLTFVACSYSICAAYFR